MGSNSLGVTSPSAKMKHVEIFSNKNNKTNFTVMNSRKTKRADCFVQFEEKTKRCHLGQPETQAKTI